MTIVKRNCVLLICVETCCKTTCRIVTHSLLILYYPSLFFQMYFVCNVSFNYAYLDYIYNCYNASLGFYMINSSQPQHFFVSKCLIWIFGSFNMTISWLVVNAKLAIFINELLRHTDLFDP